MSDGPIPGWYPDPQNPSGQRWWDGTAWTAHTTAATAGGQTVGSTTPYVRNLPPSGAGRGLYRRSGSADRTALSAMALSAVYVVLAVVAHVWFIGIFPIFMSVRAMRAGSKLGPVALAVSIAAAIASIAISTHHGGI